MQTIYDWTARRAGAGITIRGRDVSGHGEVTLVNVDLLRPASGLYSVEAVRDGQVIAELLSQQKRQAADAAAEPVDHQSV